MKEGDEWRAEKEEKTYKEEKENKSRWRKVGKEGDERRRKMENRRREKGRKVEKETEREEGKTGKEEGGWEAKGWRRKSRKRRKMRCWKRREKEKRSGRRQKLKVERREQKIRTLLFSPCIWCLRSEGARGDFLWNMYLIQAECFKAKRKVCNDVCFESVAGVFWPKASTDGSVPFQVFYFLFLFIWNAQAKFSEHTTLRFITDYTLRLWCRGWAIPVTGHGGP
jgi:hypothetical protein